MPQIIPPRCPEVPLGCPKVCLQDVLRYASKMPLRYAPEMPPEVCPSSLSPKTSMFDDNPMIRVEDQFRITFHLSFWPEEQREVQFLGKGRQLKSCLSSQELTSVCGHERVRHESPRDHIRQGRSVSCPMPLELLPSPFW